MVLKDAGNKNFLADAGKYLSQFTTLQNILQDSDMPPTKQTILAVTDAASKFELIWKKWVSLKK